MMTRQYHINVLSSFYNFIGYIQEFHHHAKYWKSTQLNKGLSLFRPARINAVLVAHCRVTAAVHSSFQVSYLAKHRLGFANHAKTELKVLKEPPKQKQPKYSWIMKELATSIWPYIFIAVVYEGKKNLPVVV